MEFSTAMRRLGMSTRDVADRFGVFLWVAREWESGTQTAPREVAAALWKWIDEQDREIERQAARLSRFTERRLAIRRCGMKGHPIGWWNYVACQVPEEVDVLIVYVD